jgi:hypothetical protein
MSGALERWSALMKMASKEVITMATKDEMYPVLKRWKESGLSLLAFAKREEVSYSKLQYWAAKLGGSKKKARKKVEAVDLAPVQLVPDRATGERCGREPVSVWLPNGVSLEVPVGFDEGELRRLVGVLSTC